MNIVNSLPPYKIPNFITSPRKMSYQRWLTLPVMDAENDDDDGTDYRRVCYSNGDYYTHKHFILDFCSDLITLLHDKGFNIENEKEFKREIAIFIYRLSRERL
jgi:hypothetical protein